MAFWPFYLFLSLTCVNWIHLKVVNYDLLFLSNSHLQSQICCRLYQLFISQLRNLSLAPVRFWQLHSICRVLTTAVRCLVVGWGWHSLCMSHSPTSWLESVFPTTFKPTTHCEIHSRSQRGWLCLTGALIHNSLVDQSRAREIKKGGKLVHTLPTHNHSSSKNLCTSVWHWPSVSFGYYNKEQ